MYNIYNSKDGCMGDEKRNRRYGDLEYSTSDNSYYNKEINEGYGNDKGNDHKEEQGCVIINIYCDNCKKEPKKEESKDNCKDSHRDCGKDNYKDNCKDPCKEPCKDEKKERKEEKSCVIINIYCNKGK